MSDADVLAQFFETLYQRYVPTEIEKRRAEGRLPENFSIQTCLIRLPKGHSPIVEFNEEFGWEVNSPELAPGVVLEAGKQVHIQDVVKMGNVIPPTFDGERVAFLFFYSNGRGIEYVYDASPDFPNFDSQSDMFPAGKVITQYLQFYLSGLVVHNTDIVQRALQQVGICPFPALLPYPMSKIDDLVHSGKLDEARQFLVSYCSSEFIDQKLVGTWWTVPVYRDRKEILGLWTIQG